MLSYGTNLGLCKIDLAGLELRTPIQKVHEVTSVTTLFCVFSHGKDHYIRRGPTQATNPSFFPPLTLTSGHTFGLSMALSVTCFVHIKGSQDPCLAPIKP